MRGTILVVDDSPVWQRIAARCLRCEGWSVRPASSARQALRMLAAGWIDLILLDLGMPGMDGLHFLEILRENSTWQSLPVIIVTGGGNVSALSKLHDLGVRCSLTKSEFSLDELTAAVAGAVEECGRPCAAV